MWLVERRERACAAVKGRAVGGGRSPVIGNKSIVIDLKASSFKLQVQVDLEVLNINDRSLELDSEVL